MKKELKIQAEEQIKKSLKFKVMKNQLLLLLTVLIASSLNAQITLEHTYSGYISVANTHLKTVYYKGPINNNQYEFYNSDYSFYKSVTVTLPYGCRGAHISNLSDKLFNTDDVLEFTCAFLDTLNNTGYYLKLIDENGNDLIDFGNVANWGYPHKTVNNEVRFLVIRYTSYPTDTETDIYSLPGSIASTKSLISEITENNPYPNPANDFIYLRYKINQSEIVDLQIFNSAGQIIDTKRIGGAFDRIRLNVSDYTPGHYIYKYKSITQSFIVE